jgi:hypothetical protein
LTKDTLKVLWCDTCNRIITSKALHHNHKTRMKDTKINENALREALAKDVIP